MQTDQTIGHLNTLNIRHEPDLLQRRMASQAKAGTCTGLTKHTHTSDDTIEFHIIITMCKAHFNMRNKHERSDIAELLPNEVKYTIKESRKISKSP